MPGGHFKCKLQKHPILMVSTTNAHIAKVFAACAKSDCLCSLIFADILWANVGKNHAQIQIGQHLSMFLTVTICLLWTIPIAFFSSISSVEGLEEKVDWIKDLNEENPWLRQVLAQVAPFIVVIVNSLLPIILKTLSVMECHISNGMVQASLFTKLASFAVIQT